MIWILSAAIVVYIAIGVKYAIRFTPYLNQKEPRLYFAVMLILVWPLCIAIEFALMVAFKTLIGEDQDSDE